MSDSDHAGTLPELLHDVRGLASVVQSRITLAISELRDRGDPIPEDLVEALRECREMGTMIMDALAPSPPGAGSVALAAVLRSEIERALRVLSGLRISLDLGDAADLHVPAPESYVHRIFGNLLRNALRHAATEVRVTAEQKVREEMPGVRVRIEDDGPGVAADMLTRLFQPGAHGGHGGRGLGLASAAWAAGKLGGTVTYRGRSRLGGAHFEVWLPRALTRVVSAAQRTDQAPPLPGIRIGIIDDNPAVRISTGRLLARLGATVLEAEPLEGTEWIDALLAGRPEVLLLDLALGSWSGLAVWKMIRERSPELADRILFFSGAAGSDAGDYAQAMTGRPVLAKPFELQALIGYLRSALQGPPR